MENYVSNAPMWAIVLFIASFLYSITFIARPARQAALALGMSLGESRNVEYGVFIFYLVWLTYAAVLALLGVLNVQSLPPRIFVFTSVPLLIILFGIIGNTGLYKKLLRAASLQSLVRLHVFRLVGVFFIVLYLYHLLPAGFALSGGLGDIITALLAVPLAKAVVQQKKWVTRAVYAWNIFGALDIINLIAIAVMAALKPIAAVTPGNAEMTLFPFVWFPAFAPATILFLHYGIFRKLGQLKEA